MTKGEALPQKTQGRWNLRNSTPHQPLALVGADACMPTHLCTPLKCLSQNLSCVLTMLLIKMNTFQNICSIVSYKSEPGEQLM